MSELDQLSINALRFLAVDAVDKAKSGHPGAPLGDSPIAYLLFHKYMRHNPKNSHWPNRDRFVLSNGHASALLYGALHLSGYDVTIEDLQQLPPVGVEDAGPSRARRHRRRRSHHRTARAGASACPSAWPSPRSIWPPSTTSRASTSSITTPTASAATAI